MSKVSRGIWIVAGLVIIAAVAWVFQKGWLTWTMFPPVFLGVIAVLWTTVVLLPSAHERVRTWQYTPLVAVWLLLPLLAWAFMARPLYDHPKVAGATFLFGALVAVSEIISRYRDEPLRAVFSPYGVAYVAINGTIALAALVLIYHFPKQFTSVADDTILAALAAGFGSSAVMRTRLAVLKGEDNKDISIGPDYVIKILLSMFDAYIDRTRAARRQQIVMDHLGEMRQLGSFREAADYLLNALLAFQNLDQIQRNQLTSLVSDYDKKPVSEDIRYLGLGFVFLTAVGEGQFATVLQRAVKARAAAPSAGGSRRRSRRPSRAARGPGRGRRFGPENTTANRPRSRYAQAILEDVGRGRPTPEAAKGDGCRLVPCRLRNVQEQS